MEEYKKLFVAWVQEKLPTGDNTIRRMWTYRMSCLHEIRMKNSGMRRTMGGIDGGSMSTEIPDVGYFSHVPHIPLESGDTIPLVPSAAAEIPDVVYSNLYILIGNICVINV
jgi:hypothetical protein